MILRVAKLALIGALALSYTLVVFNNLTDYDSNYLWRQTPWLPVYVAAGSFALLDASTFSARLPFALLGLLAVPSMYLLARRVSGDRVVATLAAG